MLGCKCSRWDSANRSVGTHLVVVLAPDGDGLTGLGQCWALFSPLGAALSLLSMGGLFLLAGYLAPMPPAER